MQQDPHPGHIPVLLDEVLSALQPRPGEVFLDCTAGLGGHAAAIAVHLVPGGTVIVNDADPGNVAQATQRVRSALKDAGAGDERSADGVKVVALHGNFADAPRKLREMGIAVDMVLADLGFASTQMADPARGLSFLRDGPLDMRFDPTLPITAAELIASLPEDELARMIREYGEEPAARRIARKLVEARREGPISTTGQLAQLVRVALGRRPEREPGRGGIDPATRTFQALRIAINDELGSLASLLEAVQRGAMGIMIGSGEGGGGGGARAWLRKGARIAIISFHSLEDRPVKRSFASMVAQGLAMHAEGDLMRGAKPVIASEEELARNPRARSAKLRAVRVGASEH